MRTLAATILALVLSACGGGGPDAGACPFPGNCPGSAAGGAAPPATGSSFTRSGTGAAVFTLPADVTLLRIRGQTTSSLAIFEVNADSKMVVYAAIGTGTTSDAHEGTYIVPSGALVEIRSATNVQWTISSATTTPPGTGVFNRSGDGAAVFDLPARSARYLIRASYPGSLAIFSMVAGDRTVVYTTIGQSQTPRALDGTYQLSGGRVQIDTSTGVKWSVTEQP